MNPFSWLIRKTQKAKTKRQQGHTLSLGKSLRAKIKAPKLRETVRQISKYKFLVSGNPPTVYDFKRRVSCEKRKKA